jgi:hypothetical protein
MDQTNSGAVAFPRTLYAGPEGNKIAGSNDTTNIWLGAWKDPANKMQTAMILSRLAEPLFQAGRPYDLQPEQRDAARIGLINEDSYGVAFGNDRDRVSTDYQHLCRRLFDQLLEQ